MITGKQNMKCGVIGEHLSHSYSPIIHEKLADYSYGIYEMPEDKVGEFTKSGTLDAFNVTIPYKKTVMKYLDVISQEAQKIGSVNTVYKGMDGKLHGDNTDYYGFLYLVKKSSIEINGKNILILGTGGASLTVLAVCTDLGAKSVRFVSRTGDINYDNVYSVCPEAEVIINTTPVGMYPKTGVSPIDLYKFENIIGVIDIIYNPAKTQLLLDAKSLGLPCINGLPMLVAQAKRACEIFLDENIDDEEIDKITSYIESQTLNIVLVGMPGCGKTTIGNIISEKIGYEFIDTDEEIVKIAKKDIPAIFSEEGEEKFRSVEHIAVAEAGKKSSHVISTGGGIVTRKENYASLTQNGVIFFIQRDTSALPTCGRPLSQAGNLEAMYKTRLPLYREFCDFEVSNMNTPESCADEIIRLYKNCLGGF